MGVNRRLHLNVYTILLAVGLSSLGLSALGWVAMQWHQYRHKIDVERLTQRVREECGAYAEQQAVYMAKQRQLDYPEAGGILKEGWYSGDEYDRDYKICVETTPPTDESIAQLTLNLVSLSRKNQASTLKEPVGIKFCPVGGELYPATVNFCPNHSVELRAKILEER